MIFIWNAKYITFCSSMSFNNILKPIIKNLNKIIDYWYLLIPFGFIRSSTGVGNGSMVVLEVVLVLVVASVVVVVDSLKVYDKSVFY